MHVIEVDNVCQALIVGLEYLNVSGEHESSRAGGVIVSPVPVTTVYRRPMERVLFDATRDANPFFHLIEAVWMLAGRRDATFLDRYVKDFSSRFAEDGGDAHGAYGARWRQHFTDGTTRRNILQYRDQLAEIGQMLYYDPTTRRAVLEMWDCNTDLFAAKKDLPCNTHVYFRAHDGRLDVTVCNRSNDIVWGAYGANAVHMSIMAEVVAGLAGLTLGTYYQVSNNYHVYEDIFEKMTSRCQILDNRYGESQTTRVSARPMINSEMKVVRSLQAADILADCVMFCENIDAVTDHWARSHWMLEVVLPAEQAHRLWRDGRRSEALLACSKIGAEDWRTACQEWMQRRMKGAK